MQQRYMAVTCASNGFLGG